MEKKNIYIYIKKSPGAAGGVESAPMEGGPLAATTRVATQP